MKKLLLLATLFANYCNAQISLDQTYTPSTVTAIVLSSAGDKIAVKDTGSNQIRIYNPDYSLWKTITPPAVSGYKFSSFAYISDNLFNSDGNLEVIAVYSNYSASSPFYYFKAQLIDESGGVLFDLGYAINFGVHYINGVYKLFSYNVYSLENKIYSLPGTIPCGKCGSLGLAKPTPTGETLLSIPNPNNGVFKVDGTGELFITDVSGKRVYQHSDYNRNVIDISKYPSGIYQVSLNGQQSTFVKQ